MKYGIILLITTLLSSSVYAQKPTIEWKTWAELEHALIEQPKPVLVYFHAEWCAYCKKITRDVFTKEEVIKKINTDYYAVNMDIETTQPIILDGVTFVNKQAKTKRNGVHELALLLASTNNKTVTLPATLLFDNTLALKQHIFSYYTSKKLLKIL
mgnify:CR=1 FL=1